MSNCMKGWDSVEFNTRGDCCCNCIYFKKVMCQPLNEEGFKGRVSEQVEVNGIPVYVCTAAAGDVVWSMTKSHGMCECHAREEK